VICSRNTAEFLRQFAVRYPPYEVGAESHLQKLITQYLPLHCPAVVHIWLRVTTPCDDAHATKTHAATPAQLQAAFVNTTRVSGTPNWD
jgi:hypothetical protein